MMTILVRIHVLIYTIFMVCVFTPAVSQTRAIQSNGIGLSQFSPDQRLDPGSLNRDLIESEIIRFTNKVRTRHRLDSCIYNEQLRNAARRHSEAMARYDFFSHESPVPDNRRFIDRLKNAGLSLGNTEVGENIGVDYFLMIASVPYYKTYSNGKVVYIAHDSGEPIEYQTYEEFAERMVDSWMRSKGHRENILNETFKRIGIGVASGKFKGMEAIYVTQNFLGSIAPRMEANEGVNSHYNKLKGRDEIPNRLF